ncbi:hypothetical protein [Mycolicibacterium hodleri]|uniref:hypothetical protein n=1 Tax=Mycolicibacterium hodleri TaxID=49897 RepID=UPI001127F5C4|nr:hypothetical protein [Mycolicibacterium hodleri]
MNSVATKFQVTAAAAALAATAVISPIAANAAPAVQFSTAPVSHLVGDFREGPAELIYFGQVTSIQLAGLTIRRRSAALNRSVNRLESYAAAHPGTFFGNSAAQAAARKRARLAEYGKLSFSACNGGTGISLGPYGTVTSGPC